MKQFVVTWTFIRHIHRHREYKIITEIITAENMYMANFIMLDNKSIRKLLKKDFKIRLKSYTDIETHEIKIGYIY